MGDSFFASGSEEIIRPAATSNIKEALNEIVGLDNAVANGDVGSSNDSLQGQLSLASRNAGTDGSAGEGTGSL